MQQQKKGFLKINRKQSLKLRSASIESKTCFKQLAVSFRIYADFEFVSQRINSNNRSNSTSYEATVLHILKNITHIFLVGLLIKSAMQLFFTEENR